jgi:hypothetical protein
MIWLHQPQESPLIWSLLSLGDVREIQEGLHMHAYERYLSEKKIYHAHLIDATNEMLD